MTLLLVAALCASILVLAEVLHRLLRVEPEWTRKLVHVLMGLVAAAFPWLFGEPRSVLLLCAAFAAVLGGSLVTSRLRSVHGVRRRTAGALWFPVGVAIVFVAAGARSDLYVLAMLVLAFADPAAAVVGRAYGAHRFRAGDDAKSVEGSLAFLVVASTTLWIGLSVTTSLGVAALTFWAIGIGGLLAGIEAVAPAGSDNVLVPVGALLLLRAGSPEHGAAAPLAAAVFVAGVVGVAAASFQRPHRERARA